MAGYSQASNVVGRNCEEGTLNMLLNTPELEVAVIPNLALFNVNSTFSGVRNINDPYQVHLFDTFVDQERAEDKMALFRQTLDISRFQNLQNSINGTMDTTKLPFFQEVESIQQTSYR